MYLVLCKKSHYTQGAFPYTEEGKKLAEDFVKVAKKKNKEEFKKLFYDEYAPTMKFLDSLSEEEREQALGKILEKKAEQEIRRGEFEAIKNLRRRGMAMAGGGLTPPESGPQSEGIESLFKNK